MASGVEGILINDEKVIYTGEISVWSLLPLLVLGPLLLPIWGIGLLFWLGAFIRYKTTGLVFKNKRVIAKLGFISRKGVEINLGIFGRAQSQAPIPGIRSDDLSPLVHEVPRSGTAGVERVLPSV